MNTPPIPGYWINRFDCNNAESIRSHAKRVDDVVTVAMKAAKRTVWLREVFSYSASRAWKERSVNYGSRGADTGKFGEGRSVVLDEFEHRAKAYEIVDARWPINALKV